MYVPKLYRNENRQEILEFIRANAFGILISSDPSQRILATHIPFTIEERAERLFLQTHVSKANTQWKNLMDLKEVLVIFQGSHTYISSSWYDHINVPTWNYIAVHVYGKVRLLEHAETLKHLKHLVDFYEGFEPNPTSLEKMTSGYVEKEMKGLIAFEIEVSEMLSAFKLSQNRNEKNIDLIVKALRQRGDENSNAIADAMLKSALQ